ncbi:hypothetical protein CIHG_10247 [Coccidioides immitis H538.4]|uniref:Uncharacterized protein n=1 Tax=Coccidioides immitis H538.4 TaxID=396776 RepID=A0A0J8S5H6_COCIT|nr:hypothetical protein CIHG_10247 [Coccidioides immitis H538.4]
MEISFSQYVVRQTFINTINNKIPASVQDQVADHDSNTVKYYLNHVVQEDIEAIMMNIDIPSRARVQALMSKSGELQHIQRCRASPKGTSSWLPGSRQQTISQFQRQLGPLCTERR